jgi:hypothetical protein
LDVATIEKPRTLEGNGSIAAQKTWTTDVHTEPEGAGWVLFSAIMLGFAGAWNIIAGILAIDSSSVYTTTATYVFSDLNTWGWIVLSLGALSLVAAFTLMSGSELARWFGIGVAGVSAIGQLMFVHANPWWSMAVFAIDMLIIYGLAVYGGARLRVR